VHSRSNAALLVAATTLIQVAFCQSPARARQRTAAPAPAVSTAPAPCPAPAQFHPQPYTLKQEITRVQTLVGGTTIKTVEDVVLARDAEGRTYRETIQTSNSDVTRVFQIFDYPTQTRYSWNDGPSKVVNVYRFHPSPQPYVPPAPGRYYPTHSDSLPPQTIDGFYASGNRFTRTIPAGYEGNDHDLTTTSETWNSTELGLLLRLVSDDPRAGKTTTETSDIQRTADPALFQPPAGYQLKDVNP
jgi:hypothetical protein